MNFQLSEDQRLFRDTARDVLTRACPPAAASAAWERGGAPDPALWAALAEAGITALTVPDEYGGLGFSMAALAPILEEAGYAGLPAPLVETAAVAAPLLAACGDAALKERWLPAIAAGEARVAVSLVTPGVGAPPLVADADAELLLVQRGGELLALTPSQVILTQVPTVDRARRWFKVALGPGEPAPFAGPAPLAAAFDRAAAGAAALLGGMSRRMLAIAVDYVTVREQFGGPVGSFQAVQHHLADARIALEFSGPVTLAAAWALSEGTADAALKASHAKARASDAADLVARKALQVHGAIGYTTECDLHLWMKPAWALRRQWGDAAWHRARVAAALLDAPTPLSLEPSHA